MSEPLTFKSFPSAKPIFPESQLAVEIKRAVSLEKSDPKRARSIRNQVRHSQDYYDLESLFKRGIAQTPANLKLLRDGFVSQNTDAYRSKSVRESPFTDKDSRFVDMDRSIAREIVLDEIFAASIGGADAGIPTDDTAPLDSKAALEGGIPRPMLLGGTAALAIVLGYMAYKRTLSTQAL